MSNNIYDSARYLLSTAGVDWRVEDLTLTAWGGVPLFDPTHRVVADLIADVGAGNKLGDSLPVSGNTVTAQGYNQTDPVVIPAVAIGREVTFFTLSITHPVPNESELFLFIDTAEGMPFISNNLDIVVIPNWAEHRGWFRA